MMEKGKRLDSAHNGKLRIEYQNNRILLVDEAGYTRFLIGPRTDGVIAAEASQSNVDVLTATDSQLTFSSRFKSFKIVDTNVISLTSPNAAGSSTFQNVTHTLGYNPMVWAFVSFSPGGTGFPLVYNEVELVGANTGKVKFQIGFETVAGNTITFYYRDITSASSNTVYIRYYIVQETAATT